MPFNSEIFDEECRKKIKKRKRGKEIRDLQRDRERKRSEKQEAERSECVGLNITNKDLAFENE